MIPRFGAYNAVLPCVAPLGGDLSSCNIFCLGIVIPWEFGTGSAGIMVFFAAWAGLAIETTHSWTVGPKVEWR